MPLPGSIPSVCLWTDEAIQADTERIMRNPTRLDRLRTFAAFVTSESQHFLQYTTLPGLCIQQALNYAATGPVLEAAERILQAGVSTPLLLQNRQQRNAYTPHPALLRTLTGHTDGVTSVSLTPDGRTAVSGSGDHTLRVWDLVTGQCTAIFPTTSPVGTVAMGGQLGLGIVSGQVVFVTLHGWHFGPPILTAIRLFPGAHRKNRCWGNFITAPCEHCGQRFTPAPGVLDAIRDITARLTPDQSPCLALPSEAWDEPRLLSTCPHCYKPVKFNPFIADSHNVRTSRFWPMLRRLFGRTSRA